MLLLLRMLGWVVCVVYSTIPLFWLMIHPRAHRWRNRAGSPYKVLVPVWIFMWVGVGALTAPWRRVVIYERWWSWILAGILVGAGLLLYKLSRSGFSPTQLYGLPEIVAGNQEQRLVTTGIRARVRHPVYLGHLCEILGWSVGTGLVVCWALTGFAMVTGAVMIRMEDAELAKRFGEEYAAYQQRVPAVLPRVGG
jgi:protein-S-isoprenylcysteine O-methyltransferase Ste14